MSNAKDINTALGNELYYLRARRRLSQPQMAEVLEPLIGRKVHASTMSAWEKGATPITVELLGIYATEFEIGIGEIIRRAGLDEAA